MAEAQPEPGSGAAGGQSGSVPPDHVRFYVESNDGSQSRATCPYDTLVSDLALDFFDEHHWPTQDPSGQPVRAAVDLVPHDNPEATSRLHPDQTLRDAGVRNDDTLRVFPESVAGAVEPQQRLQALVVDQREVLAIAAGDPEHIQVKTNADYAPTRYELTLRYTGVRMGDRGPELTSEHRLELYLPADYPLSAPVALWLTPIYHPNISKRGHVCLGVLADQYMPGVGLAYVVRMLIDIARYRNYDLEGVFDLDAAGWVKSPEGQETIQRIGGKPLEQPLKDLLDQARRAQRPNRIRFEPVNRFIEDE